MQACAALGTAAPVLLPAGIDYLLFWYVAGHQVDEGEQQAYGAGC